MSNIKLLTVTNAPEHAEVLRRSALHHNWDYTCIEVKWRGFGSKLIGVYNYLKEHIEVERFVFADAFDVVVMGTEQELIEKIGWWHDKVILSCEKGLWPPQLHAFRSKYRESGSPFNFINSGVYISSRENFLSLMNDFPVNYDHDDQLWLNICYLLEPERFVADFNQVAFNSHSFIADGEYTYNNGRVQIMGNEPVFVHKNGRTPDPKLDELVKNMLSL